jgi:hypothetical protein
MREAIMRMSASGKSIPEIASVLGQTPGTIRTYRKESLEKAVRGYDPGDPSQVPPPESDDPIPGARNVKGSGPGPHRPRSSKAIPAIASARLTDADEQRRRDDCLDLRKRGFDFRAMSERTGLREDECRRYTYEALRMLDESEMHYANLERRLVLEQIDQMIRAVHPYATTQTGNKDAPMLDAIDRMLKLLRQKAELMGLAQPQTIDVMIRLQQIAEEGNYDMLELQEIAREVFAKHRIRLPVVVSGRATDPASTPRSEDDDPGRDRDGDEGAAGE